MLEAGVRDDRVEPSETLERRVHHVPVALARGEVRVVDVDAVHRPAVHLEPLDDGAADPSGRARHERRFHANGPQRMTLAAHV